MEKADEALKKAALTLEKYRKNKTLVAPEDLKGKYEVPFQKLKHQLAEELVEYLRQYCLAGFIIQKETDPVIEKIQKSFDDNQIGKRVGQAAFRRFDLEEIKKIAADWRREVERIWTEYFNEHVCLYTWGQCYAEESTATPLIYNDLVDKFWDEAAGEWTDREKPPGAAILIFIKKGQLDEQQRNV